jgi:hypothetical protein
MTDDVRWFIYTLSSPRRPEKVRYVGSTVCPKERARTHLSDARTRKRNYPIHKWMRALLAKNLAPIMTVIDDGVGKKTRIIRESYWILFHRKKFSDILNVSDGWNPTVPVASRKRAGDKLRGRTLSPEHCLKISLAKIGTKRPDIAERNRHSGISRIGKKMNLSDAERARRAEHGRAKLVEMRENMTDETRAIISRKASIQMKAVWAARRLGAQNDGSGAN